MSCYSLLPFPLLICVSIFVRIFLLITVFLFYILLFPVFQLRMLVKGMLSLRPKDRPTADQVSQIAGNMLFEAGVRITCGCMFSTVFFFISYFVIQVSRSDILCFPLCATLTIMPT